MISIILKIISEVDASRGQQVMVLNVFQGSGRRQRHVFDVTVVMLKGVIKEVTKLLPSFKITVFYWYSLVNKVKFFSVMFLSIVCPPGSIVVPFS